MSASAGQSLFDQMLAMKRNDDSGGGGGGEHASASNHGGATGFSNPVFSEKIDIFGGNHEDLLSSASDNVDKSFGTLTGSVDFDFGAPFDHLVTGSAKGVEDLQLHELASGADMGAGPHLNSTSRSAGMGITEHGRNG